MKQQEIRSACASVDTYKANTALPVNLFNRARNFASNVGHFFFKHKISEPNERTCEHKENSYAELCRGIENEIPILKGDSLQAIYN